MPTKIKDIKWNFFTKVDMEKKGAERLPGLDFKQLFADIQEAGVTQLEVSVNEVIDWDMAPMRKYFHGAVVPAFVEKFNNAYYIEVGYLDRKCVKEFLKAKFLGWDINSTGYKRWKKRLQLVLPVKDIIDFMEISYLNELISPKIEINSTADLEPERYMWFINRCEAYYFQLFKEMFDKKEKPVL